jgi:hypothetical protein
MLNSLYVQKHKDFKSDRVNAFACDITSEQLTEGVESSSVDIVTMVTYYTLITHRYFSVCLHLPSEECTN